MALESMVKRSDKLAFFKMAGTAEDKYTRMTGFTEMSQSKNPKERTRQYIDEEFERTDVVGYAPSISFGFDEYEENPVHQAIARVFDEELTGGAALCEILIVDLSKEESAAGKFAARKRVFSVIPGEEGGELEAYTYSGELKANGKSVPGSASTTDEWQNCSFTVASGESV